MTIDKTWIGVILGLIFPIITAYLFYKLAYHGTPIPFDEFLEALIFIRGIGMLLAVSCLPNLALFSIFVNINKLKISRGLFLATMVFAFAIIVFKFIV